MSDPEIQYVTVTSPSMVKGTKPCACGCKGLPRHRVKLTMEEWGEEGADGKVSVPVLWPTKLSAGERDRFQSSLQDLDEKLERYVPRPEWARSHWIAFCARDHQNHRIWEDLEEARRQLEDLDDDEVRKLVAACDEAQVQPGRAEGNAAVPSEKTQDDSVSGDTPETADMPPLTVS